MWDFGLLGAEAVNSTHAQQLNLEAALQSFVLLKNDEKTLPLSPDMKTAVIGPHVLSTRDLMSDYKGDQQCAGGSYDCVPTIAEFFSGQLRLLWPTCFCGSLPTHGWLLAG